MYMTKLSLLTTRYYAWGAPERAPPLASGAAPKGTSLGLVGESFQALSGLFQGARNVLMVIVFYLYLVVKGLFFIL